MAFDLLIPEPLGGLLGICVCLLMVYLYKHCDLLENGNIEKEEKHEIFDARPRAFGRTRPKYNDESNAQLGA